MKSILIKTKFLRYDKYGNNVLTYESIIKDLPKKISDSVSICLEVLEESSKSELGLIPTKKHHYVYGGTELNDLNPSGIFVDMHNKTCYLEIEENNLSFYTRHSEFKIKYERSN